MAEPRLLSATPDESRLVARTLPLLRGHGAQIAATTLVSLAAAAASVAGIALLGAVTDAVVAADRPAVLRGALLYAALVLAAWALGWLSQWLVVVTGERFVRRLRDHAITVVAQAPVRFLESHRTGDLLRRLTGEIAELSAFVGSTLPSVTSSLVTLLLTVVLLLGYSWPLTLVLLAIAVGGSLPLGRRYLRRAGPAYAAVAAADAQVSATIAESLPAREQLVVLGARQRRLAHLDGDNEALLTARISEVRADRWLTALAPLHGIGLVALVVLALVGTQAGWLSVGAVVVFLVAARTAFADFEELVAGIGELRASRTSLARVLDLAEAAAPDAAARTELLPASGVLTAESVGFGYADHPVLHDVSLTVHPGERVALVGPTGSGKTTLAKLLAGLYRPDSGEVRYGGVALHGLAAEQLRRRVVLVPQEVLLVRGSLAANLAMAPGVTDDGVGRARMAATVAHLGLADWLAGLPAGLDTEVGEQGMALSAGERQLVALVRVVLTGAAALILDEATADVDPATAARVEDALTRASADRAVVVVAHRPDTIARADRLVRLDAGRIVSPDAATGSPQMG